jgi:fimbrial chaperone protein
MRCAILFAALIAALPAATAARAQVSMDVAPTTLELVPGRPGLFYVSNHGSHPVDVRLDGFDWRQPGGDDVLIPSDDLVVSPVEATIAPGARQLVRVLVPAAAGERSFRLVVSELPGMMPAADNGVRILLRFGVPVFAAPAAQIPAPVLSWTASRRGTALLVDSRNDGARTVKLVGVTLKGAGGATAKPDADTFVYVLPGASHRFAFSHAPAGAELRIVATDARSGVGLQAALAPPR